VSEKGPSSGVSAVYRFMKQPRRKHWKSVKKTFRYFGGTSDVSLIYGGDAQRLDTDKSDSD
jgi:hypothetical protein